MDEQDVLVCVLHHEEHTPDSTTDTCSTCERVIWVSEQGRQDAKQLDLRFVCEDCMPENGAIMLTPRQFQEALWGLLGGDASNN